MAMADHQQPDWRDDRYQEHVSFYDGFMKFATAGTGAVIVLLVLLALFLL